MKNFRAIGFDWGGVILQYPAGSFNGLAARFLGINKDAFDRAFFLHSHMVNKAVAYDFDHADDMWGKILRELGKEERLNDFIQFVKNVPKGFIDQRMLALVAILKKSGFAVGMLSNMTRSGAEKFLEGGYEQFFDAVLFSSEIGFMKPEPEAFLKLAEALRVDIAELVFIDDSEKSLETAKQVGYEPILFGDYDALVAQLRNLGVTLSR